MDRAPRNVERMETFAPPAGMGALGRTRASAAALVRGGWGAHLAALTWQYLFSVLMTSVLARKYLSYVPEQTSTVGWTATLAALVSTAALLNLVVFLVLAAPVLVLRRSWFTLGAPPLLFGLLNILLCADSIVYGLYRFHLNGMVVNLLTTSGAGDSYTLGRATILSSLKVIVLILGIQGAFSLLLLPSLQARGFLPRPSRVFRIALPLLFGIFLADKAWFAYGDLYNRPELTRSRHLFPLYRPIVMRDFAHRWLGVEAAHEENLSLDYGANALRYPKAPLVFPPGGRRPNVVIIAIEGCRYDMLDPEIMPFLHAWSRTQVAGSLHYSGGNASRFGIFSMLYGIYGTYWHKVRAERQGPALVTDLRKLGYRFRILSGDNLNYPEFRKTAFIEIPESITDTWTCGRTRRDQAMTDLFVQFLDEGKGPFFSFLFYDAPHQPYLFPPEHEVFRPFLDKRALDYTSIADDAVKAGLLRNRFKNSQHYVDSQLARVVHAIEERGLLDDTLVFIAGDHGEEFNELGYHGHNGTFDRYQTRTVMVAHIPGEQARTIARLTSHLDIVPTIFTSMGVANPISDYSQGVPLTSATGPDHVVISSWDSAALVAEDGRTVVFGTDSTNPGFETLDGEYRPTTGGLGELRAPLLEVMKRMSEYSR